MARACGVPVGRRSGSRLATTLVATINVIIFFLFFPPSSNFLIEGVLRSKNLFRESPTAGNDVVATKNVIIAKLSQAPAPAQLAGFR